MTPNTVDEVQDALAGASYIADRPLAVTIHLALQLGRPLFLEGEAGVGKTEIAKVLAHILGEDLIRLQCYEGLDVSHALYEWDYARQMLAIRMAEATSGPTAEVTDIMSREFLLARPLLQAIELGAQGKRPVLLIDELDRADEEFEAYLLELLSDFQVTIPEVATIKARVPPVVVITSNRTREIHDALKRRCLYHWIDYPSYERELEIMRAKAPDLPHRLAEQLATAMQQLRAADLFKAPGVAETLDWGHALTVLGRGELNGVTIDETLGVVLKYQEDLTRVRANGVEQLLVAE
ncbi:MAG: MoxR family ATPase [bacterium]|nr:MoxR family ATPase [bacterium]